MNDKEFQEKFIDGIVKISNHKSVLNVCEPNIMRHKVINRKIVERVLYSMELLKTLDK